MPLTSSRESAVKICRNSHCRNKAQPLLSRKACRTEFGKNHATRVILIPWAKEGRPISAWADSARLGAECHGEIFRYATAPFFFVRIINSFFKRRFDK